MAMMMMTMVVMNLGMMSVIFVVYVRVETVVFVSRICYFSDTTVRFDQAIAAVNYVPVPFFPLVFVVLRVWVFDAVLERILGRWLYRNDEIPMKNKFLYKKTRCRKGVAKILSGDRTRYPLNNEWLSTSHLSRKFQVHSRNGFDLWTKIFVRDFDALYIVVNSHKILFIDMHYQWSSKTCA